MDILIKTFLTVALIVGASELSKRSVWMASVLISIPLSSVLAAFLMHRDGAEAGKIADFTFGILWLILPSTVYFIVLPFLLRKGMAFYPAMFISLATTFLSYTLAMGVLKRLGVVA